MYHGNMLHPYFRLLDRDPPGLYTTSQSLLLLDSLKPPLFEDLPQDSACLLVRFLRLLIGPERVRALIPGMLNALDISPLAETL
jgi:hypothetical protein